jgi:hypothetical protein
LVFTLKASGPVDTVHRELAPRVVVRKHLIPSAGERRDIVATIPHLRWSAIEKLSAVSEVDQ